GPERIGEAYYAASLAPGVTLSADVQAIGNPAYNRDRGPVRVWGLRLHAEF
ncbi:MAG: carbohydrate porin, partial [Burkholderiales bacterium]|nr:carbohydrate porin [Burkholderiales bacterium]